MLAMRAYEDSRCPGCGGDAEETFHPDNQFAYRIGDPHRCHLCTAIDKAAEAYLAAGGEHMRALRFRPERG